MGTFGFFFGILTFIYVIYYAVVIFLDLRHMDAQKGNKSEIIPVGNAQSAESDEEDDIDDGPVHVSEHDYLDVGTEDTEVLTAEEIRMQDTEELYRRSMSSRKEMEPVHPKATNEFSVTNDYDELARFENDELAEDVNKVNSSEEEE